MHRISLKDFSRMTGEDLFTLTEKAERGETVRNIDLSEYAERNQRGEVEAVQIPDRLMPNLRPGGVSKSTSAEAFDAGRAAQRREQEEGATATVEHEDGTTEEVEVEVQSEEENEKEASGPPARQNESGKPAKEEASAGFSWSNVFGTIAVLGGLGLAVKDEIAS